jgi:luciferase family oxidoreductase group 1
VLEALYPGRIDLGIGRAPGTTPLVSHALQRTRTDGPVHDDFASQLVELLAWLGDGFPSTHPYSRIELAPTTESAPAVWLLGSSPWSAAAAAQLALPYCFAGFINPDPARACLAAYRERYDIGAGGGPKPVAMLALGAVVADTDEEAARLMMSSRALRHRITHGRRGPIPSPDDAIVELGQEPKPMPDGQADWPRYVYGRPGVVVERLAQIAAEAEVDELMVVTITHDHEARCRSYELLAKELLG